MIGGMIIGLLMGCNNGEIEKLGKRNNFLSSVVSLGNEFLNVFTSFGDTFGDMFSETLGFKADSSKKADVGKYFKKIHDKVEDTKTALNKIVENMKAENNPNAAAVKTKVEELINNKLSKIIAGSKTAFEAIGTEGLELIGNVADRSAAGVGVFAKNINKLVEGIKGIVEVVLKKEEGNPDVGDDKLAKDGTTPRTYNSATAGEAGKLFAAIGSEEKESANDAAKAVGAVTGADILKAIIKGDSNGDAAKLATTGNTTNKGAPKDATIAGAIALMAMAKDGKFANARTGTAEVVAIVKNAAISAVTKALNTLAIAIRKTIDEGLKTVQEAMNINANDTPVTTETSASAK